MLVNLLLLLAFLALAFAEKAGPALNWKSVAIDTSGKYHVAAAAYNNDWDQGYSIYLSDDYGANWSQSKSPSLDWRNIYSDSTGQLLIGYAAYNSFTSSSYPPLQISKDRGNTWTTGASTSSLSFNKDITAAGNSSTLWTVLNSNLYSSTDDGKTWASTTKILNAKGTGYAVIGDGSVDSTGKHRYVTCDGGFCASHNSGQTWTTNWSLLASSVETDATGQYVFILTDKAIQYSSDYGSTFTITKDYTVPYSSKNLDSTILKISSDHQYVYTLENLYFSSTSWNIARYSLSTKATTYLLTTYDTINDFAFNDAGTNLVVSTTNGKLLTTTDSGFHWTTHNLS
mmetsp:Transcript_18638/g.20263  ORF Transcript_18638/g.20263 Transcript_18638/m.20263 type:complete len:342 (-) Transcript_18638:148-1173(-)